MNVFTERTRNEKCEQFEIQRTASQPTDQIHILSHSVLYYIKQG